MTRIWIVLIASLVLAGCAAEADDLEISQVDQAVTSADSADFVSVSSGWGLRRHSSFAGVHKIQCMHAGVIGGEYYTSSHQGWSNESWCSAANYTGWAAGCSGSGVSGHNIDHETCNCGGYTCACDHWMPQASYGKYRSDVKHEACSYSVVSTCNSKDWMEHNAECNGYWEDCHGGTWCPVGGASHGC